MNYGTKNKSRKIFKLKFLSHIVSIDLIFREILRLLLRALTHVRVPTVMGDSSRLLASSPTFDVVTFSNSNSLIGVDFHNCFNFHFSNDVEHFLNVLINH